MEGENHILFAFPESDSQGKERKKPQSEASKRLQLISGMEDRDFQNLKNKLDRGQPLTAGEAKRLESYRRKYEEISGGNLPAHIVRTDQKVAEYFGKSIRTIRYWKSRQSPMPMLPEGYDLQVIETWALREGLISKATFHDDNAKEGNDEEGPKGKGFYETELKKAQAALKSLELARAEGKLIPVEEVEAGRVARIMSVKRALLATPRALAPQLVGLEIREIEALLMEKMREVCTRFAQGEI